MSLGQRRAVNVYVFSEENNGDNNSSSVFRSPRPLTSTELRADLELHPPVKLQWSFPPGVSEPSTGDADDLTHWTRLCDEVGSVPTESLTRLSLTLPKNEKGLRFVMELLRNMPMPHVKQLELADNFSCYEETLNEIHIKLPLLEVLWLRNTAFASVSNAFSKFLASYIRSSQLMRKFSLAGVQFPCQADFQFVLEALLDSPTLEDVSFYHLTVGSSGNTSTIKDDFFTEKLAEEKFIFHENHLCTRYLAKILKLSAPYTVLQRLQVLLRMRRARIAASPATTMIDSLASVSDRVDFGYEFLRHHVDPAIWANAS